MPVSRPARRRGRFLHEAQSAAQLRHPNVASVFHFGTTNEPRRRRKRPTQKKTIAAIASMRWSSSKVNRSRHVCAAPDRFSATFALEIALQVARALVAAEKRGLVHRDLKPSNIMLAAEGETIPANDLRGSSATGEGESHRLWPRQARRRRKRLIRARAFFGTSAFSSPEQRASGGVDSRSDIYSLGATLWYALTGKVPGDRSAETPLPMDQTCRARYSRAGHRAR